MPVYEYHCNKCQKEFEVNQSIISTQAQCPDCGLSTNKRLISLSSFALKGDCWYKDGYSKQKKE